MGADLTCGLQDFWISAAPYLVSNGCCVLEAESATGLHFLPFSPGTELTCSSVKLIHLLGHKFNKA